MATRVTFSFCATAFKLLVMVCSSRSSLITGSAATLPAAPVDPFLAGKNKKLGGDDFGMKPCFGGGGCGFFLAASTSEMRPRSRPSDA